MRKLQIICGVVSRCLFDASEQSSLRVVPLRMMSFSAPARETTRISEHLVYNKYHHDETESAQTKKISDYVPLTVQPSQHMVIMRRLHMIQGEIFRCLYDASKGSSLRVVPLRMMSSSAPARESTRISEHLVYNKYHHDETGKEKTPLILFLPWLTATPKSAQRFEDLYGLRGFNVLTVWSRLRHFVWPKACIPVAEHVLEYLLRTQADTELVIHGMSMGAYVYAMILMSAMKKEAYYNYMKQHVKGNVFDSIVYGSTGHMATGMSKTFTHSVIVEKLTSAALLTYLKVTESHTAKILDEAIKTYEQNPFLPSSLVLFSTVDPMSDHKMIEALARDWQDRGVHVEIRKWTDSGHAELLKHHSMEYTEALDKYLAFVKPTLNRPLKAKL